MSKDNLDNEFAYHKYKLQLTENNRKHLQALKTELDGISSTNELRAVSLAFAELYVGETTKAYDNLLVIGVLGRRYKIAVTLVALLFWVWIISIVSFIAWLFLH